MADPRQILQEIYERHGRLTSAIVIEEARPKNSPLHDQFDWDVKRNAEQFLLIQATRLIRKYRIVFNDSRGESVDVRAFYSVRDDEGRTYMPTTEIAATPFLSEMLRRDMERRWRRLRTSYERFEEFRTMVLGDLGKEDAS